MPCAILEFFGPRPLTSKWLGKHASPSSRKDFEASSRALGTTPMYHVTSLDRAQSIYRNGHIYGVDVVNSAHFHHTPQGAARQADRTGVLLGFRWSGSVVRVNLSDNSSSHKDRRPNVLFDVPITEYGAHDTWELRLYPGTAGLFLDYVEVGKQGFCLRTPKSLRVSDEPRDGV
jgi:hypothetical protein